MFCALLAFNHFLFGAWVLENKVMINSALCRLIFLTSGE